MRCAFGLPWLGVFNYPFLGPLWFDFQFPCAIGNSQQSSVSQTSFDSTPTYRDRKNPLISIEKMRERDLPCGEPKCEYMRTVRLFTRLSVVKKVCSINRTTIQRHLEANSIKTPPTNRTPCEMWKIIHSSHISTAKLRCIEETHLSTNKCFYEW